MNSTKWTTLSGFCEYLSKTGKVSVEHSERGPIIELTERTLE